jgi:putative membrane protein
MMKKVSSILMIVLFGFILQACHSNTKDDSTENVSTQAGAIVNEDDAKFAVEAYIAGVNEVELSFFVKDKLTNSKLKSFAETEMSDHSRINNELMAITKPAKLTLPVSLSSDGQQAEDELSQQTGIALEKAYAVKMAADHESTVKLFENAADNVKDATLKAFAVKTLPILKKHQDEINAINNSIK